MAASLSPARRNAILYHAAKVALYQGVTMASTSMAQMTIAANNQVLAGLNAAKHFNQTCHLGSHEFDAENGTLGLYCNNDDWVRYDYNWTSIDLDKCVGNNGGTLIPFPNGNYSNSCKSCNITWSHVYLSPVTLTTTQSPPGLAATITATTLSTPHWDDLYLVCASCANLNGIMQAGGTVDLNEVMTNNDGTIGCYSYIGTALPAEPTGIFSGGSPKATSASTTTSVARE